MTELPPPAPPAGTATGSPPPPPPHLVAPHGAPPRPALARVGALATAVRAVTGVAAALALVSIWATAAARDDARAFLDGTISRNEFVERAAPYLLMTTVQGVAVLATAVVSMVWMYRMARNHRALHRGGTWGPGWAIGGWLLPPLVYVIPTLMFRELWRASDPDVPIGGDWRSRPTSPLVWLWFVLYSIAPLGILVAQGTGGLSLGASERELAAQIVDDRAITTAGSLLTVAAAVVYVLLVRGLTGRHRRLTGEDALG